MENSPFFEPVPETVHVELRCETHKKAVEIGVYAPPERIGLAFRDFLIEHADCAMDSRPAVTARTWDEENKWPCPRSLSARTGGEGAR